MSSYWKNITQGISSLLGGLKLTFRHLFQAGKSKKPLNIESNNYFDQQTGIVTLQYPHETLPVPDNGRYRLHNEVDDCIVCDLCAKICPVNCIEIEAIKSTEEIGKTSDGSTKRLYAGKFDIDMAKCCYCGLCTTVCPTECLTMTKTYDFPEIDIRNMVYHFTDLSPEQAKEKSEIYEESQRIKAELKKANKTVEKAKEESLKAKDASDQPKPAFKPVIKPVAPKIPVPAIVKDKDIVEEKNELAQEKTGQKKAAFKPIIKPVLKTAPKPESKETPEIKAEPSPSTEAKKSPVKPIIKPVIKPKPDNSNNQ